MWITFDAVGYDLRPASSVFSCITFSGFGPNWYENRALTMSASALIEMERFCY